MADLDVHVVAPVRLKLVTTPTAVSEAESSTIRETLGVSDSVLSKHLAALASPRPATSLRRREAIQSLRRAYFGTGCAMSRAPVDL